MPKIITHNSKIAATGRLNVRRAQGSDFGGGQGLIQAGADIGAFAATLKAKEEQADVTRVRNLQSQAMLDLTTAQTDMETQAELGAPGHVDATREGVSSYYSNLRDHATTEKGKSLLAEQEARMSSAFTIQAINFSSKSKGKLALSELVKTLDNEKETLLKNPDMLDVVLDAQKTRLNDPSGMYKNSLDAGALSDHGVEAANEATMFAIRGYTRDNPKLTLERVKSGEFNDTLNADSLKLMVAEAEQGVNAQNAALKAQKTAADDAQKAARLRSGDNAFSMIHGGKTLEGEPVTVTQAIDLIAQDQNIPAFGPGPINKDNIIGILELKAKGDTTKEMDDAEKSTQNAMLVALVTGKDSEGAPVSLTDLRDQVISSPDLDVFGSGSKDTIIKMIDDREAGVSTPLNKRQDELLNMIFTGEDTQGNELVLESQIAVIRMDKTLPATGVGSKSSFITMARERDKTNTAKSTAANTDDVYGRLFLPPDDPKHVSVDMLSDPTLVRKLGMSNTEGLRKVANKLLDPAERQLEVDMKSFFDGRKSSITETSLIKGDAVGDVNYGLFVREARRLVEEKADKKEDPRVLFDPNSKEYLGAPNGMADKFVRSQKQRIQDTSRAARGLPPLSVIEDDPLTRQEGESTEDYLARIN